MKKMKTPRIRVEGEHGTLMDRSLYSTICELVYSGEFPYNGKIKIYLDDVELEIPIEMEDDDYEGEG